MLDSPKVNQLAALLAEARRAGRRLAVLPADLVPVDTATADAVQERTAALLGEAVGGYKVAQIGDGPGNWGLIGAPRIVTSPARAASTVGDLKIELELAFRLGHDLPGRADGAPYTASEVADAIAAAFAAFELVESRLPAEPKPSPLAARADAMSNFGLVIGAPVADWRARVHTDLDVALTIDGRAVVARRGGHPAGDPAHPLVWLANALVQRGRGLVAGQIVTTGAFGGSHPLAPGATVSGVVEGFDPVAFVAAP